MANNWTRGAAHRHTTAPISALGLHPVARISRPAEGRRLSWPEQTVSNLLKVACRWPGRDSHSQRESYESDTLPLDHLHLQRHIWLWRNCPELLLDNAPAGSWTCNLSIASPTKQKFSPKTQQFPEIPTGNFWRGIFHSRTGIPDGLIWDSIRIIIKLTDDDSNRPSDSIRFERDCLVKRTINGAYCRYWYSRPIYRLAIYIRR